MLEKNSPASGLKLVIQNSKNSIFNVALRVIGYVIVI